MKNFKSLFAIAILGILLSSCAKVYYSHDAKTLAQNQSTLAILPPQVAIAPNKRVDLQTLIEQEQIESENFQKAMYSWILKRKMQGKFTPEVQDLEITNARLEAAGYFENKMTSYELCEILNVDAVMGAEYSLSKPISDGAALALWIVFDVLTPTNEVNVSMNIKDCANNKLIWNYDHEFSGVIGSTSEELVDRLMRRASKKMPYKKR